MISRTLRPVWDRVLHAYGMAVDTPAHLESLAGADQEAAEQAFHHLWSAVLHQGTMLSRDGAGRRLAGGAALRDGRLEGGPCEEGETREVAAASFVAEAFRSAAAIEEVAEPSPERRARLERAIADYGDEADFWADDDVVNDVFVLALVELRALAPTAVETAEHLLGRGDPVLLAPALDLLVQATLAIPGADSAGRARPHAADGPELVRVTAVLGLGELGADTSPYLSDDSLAGARRRRARAGAGRGSTGRRRALLRRRAGGRGAAARGSSRGQPERDMHRALLRDRRPLPGRHRLRSAAAGGAWRACRSPPCSRSGTTGASSWRRGSACIPAC